MNRDHPRSVVFKPINRFECLLQMSDVAHTAQISQILTNDTILLG